MDKLQPLIKHRFWILIGLVIPLALYGFSTAAGLKEETEQRIQKIDQVKNGIKSGENAPNERYQAGLQNLTGTYAAYVNEAIVDVWERQQARMVWPDSFKSFVPPQLYGPITNEQARINYQLDYYPRIVEEMYQHIDPVKPKGAVETDNASDYVGQKVIVTARIPHQSFPREGAINTTSEQLWDAQIDVWLMTLLFDSISKTNGNSDTVADAIVRRLDKFELMGGDGAKVGETAVGVPGSGVASAPAKAQTAAEMYQAMLDAQEAADAAALQGTDEGVDTGGSEVVESVASKQVAFAAQQEFGAPVGRYIAYDPNAHRFQRGFYMSVIVLQDKLPDFLTDLANADWPIQIDRFHVGLNPYAVRINASNAGANPNQVRSVQERFNVARPLGRGGRMGLPLPMGRDPLAEAAGDFDLLQYANPQKPAAPPLVTVLTDATIPKFARDALGHPDLVQVDLCGRVTMFRSPDPAILQSVAARRAPPAGQVAAGPAAAEAPAQPANP